MTNFPFSVWNTLERMAGRRWPAWVRTAVIAVLFLLVAFLAVRTATERNPLNMLEDPLLLVFPALVGALVLLRFPMVGLLALVVAGLAIDFDLDTGTATKINAAVLIILALVGIWIFDLVVQKKRALSIHSRTFTPLLVFLVTVLVAFASGQLPYFYFAERASITAQLGGVLIFFLSAGIFLWVAAHVRDLRWLEWAVWLYLGIGAFHLIARVVPGMDWLEGKIVQQRVFNHSLFWVWMVILSFSQAAFNTKLGMRWRAALGLLLMASFYVSIVQDSAWTSGWLPAMAGLGVALLLSGSRWSWVAILLGVIAVVLKLDSFQRLIFAGDNEYSLLTRIEAWRIIGDIVSANPLLGLGPANYYWYTPLYSILGYEVQFNSHNNFVDLIAQVGLIGLGVFLWFSWSVFKVSWWLRTRVPNGFPRAYVLGGIGGLAATLVAGMLGDWFLPFVYNIGLQGVRASMFSWLFLGGVVAIEQMLREGLLPMPGAENLPEKDGTV